MLLPDLIELVNHGVVLRKWTNDQLRLGLEEWVVADWFWHFVGTYSEHAQVENDEKDGKNDNNSGQVRIR